METRTGSEASLYNITNFESGIVIAPNGEALLTNWFALHISGIPRIFAGAIIGLGEDLQILETKALSRNAIISIVDKIQNNLTIVSDTDDSLTPEDVTSGGKLYKIESNGEIFTVITVDDWH